MAETVSDTVRLTKARAELRLLRREADRLLRQTDRLYRELKLRSRDDVATEGSKAQQLQTIVHDAVAAAVARPPGRGLCLIDVAPSGLAAAATEFDGLADPKPSIAALESNSHE